MHLWSATAPAQVEFTGEIVEINTAPGMGTIRLDWHAKGWLQKEKWKLQIAPQRHEVIEILHDAFMQMVSQITNQPTLFGGGDLDGYYYRVDHAPMKQPGETAVAEIGRGRGLVPGGTHELLPAAWLGWFALHFILQQEPHSVLVRGLWFRHNADANPASLLSDALLVYNRVFDAESLPFHFTVAETAARDTAQVQHFMTGGHKAEISIGNVLNAGEVILQQNTTIESFIGGGQTPYRIRIFKIKSLYELSKSHDFDIRPELNGKFFYTDYRYLDRQPRAAVQMLGENRWPAQEIVEATYRERITPSKALKFTFLPQSLIVAILIIPLALWLTGRFCFNVNTKQPSSDHERDKT